MKMQESLLLDARRNPYPHQLVENLQGAEAQKEGPGANAERAESLNPEELPAAAVEETAVHSEQTRAGGGGIQGFLKIS